MKAILLFTLLTVSFSLSAQTNIYIRHNKLIQNKTSNGGYYIIGVYKVQGNPYITKGEVSGDFYSVPEIAKNIKINYNVYNQDVEFISSGNPDQWLVKEPGDLDSFLLRKNDKAGLSEDALFVYAKQIGATDKFYYQVLVKGAKYSVYKRSRMDLVIPMSNYGQSELREFEKNTDYWYVNETTRGLKKINASVSAVKKEFEGVKDLSNVLKSGSMFKNPDNEFIKVFTVLNE